MVGDGGEMRALGPWVHKRIEFQATSTYVSSPAMEPLNEPIEKPAALAMAPLNEPIATAGGANGGGGVDNRPNQQQYGKNHQNQQVPSGDGIGAKLGRSEPLSLPSGIPLQWAAPQKIGAGLSNLGNTCFLNSVLQCLTYTPPLAGYLQSGQHKASCRVAGFCAFCALQEHVQQALASSGKVVSPQKLAKNLRSICRSFRMGRQEDSHEYMRYLLEALHKCCLPPDLAKNSNSKSSQEKSLVYRIFGGQLRSQVKCTICSHCSDTYDPFLDLSLEIVRADSLTKALTRFTAVDVLDGDNKYRCLRCKKKVRALKRFTIDLVPNILTIQFKRFSSTGGQGGKIDKKVEFGTTLDLKPFVSNGQDNVPKFKLFGVLVHSGWSTHSGHYYSFLRASSDIWHVFDDTRVRQVSERTVLEQKAYMLFYVREGKRVSSSYSELVSTKQASPQSVLVKGRESNPDSGVAPRHASSPTVSVLAKDGERKSLSAGLPQQASSDPARETNGHMGLRLEPVALQPVSVSSEETRRSPVQSNPSNGLTCARSVIPTVNGSDCHVSAAVPAVSDPSCLDEPAVGLCPPVGEHCVPAKAKYCNKEIKIDNSSTTKGNPGFEDDWDEYYKKGWNPPGSTPQNFMKMLRVIPHTRRYYQARSLPGRRTSKIASNVNGELQIGHTESSQMLTTNVVKDAKRCHSFNEDLRGAKRQQRESSANCMSKTCLAVDEFHRTDPVTITPSNGHRSVMQESVAQWNGLHSDVETASDGNRLFPVGLTGSKIASDLKVVKRLPVMTGGNVGAESNGRIYLDTNHRVLQHSGAELRVGSGVDNNGQVIHDLGLERKSYTTWSNSEKGTETSLGALPIARNDLYGNLVPRWSDIDGNDSSVKEIDRLLEAEKGESFQQDMWDVEYDRGRSKKVRNKASQQSCDSRTGNGISKPSNPFQNFGIARSNGNGIKQGNSIGFKAGYGYGLKTSRKVGIAG